MKIIVVSTEYTTTVLAENVSVSEIPTEPYVFELIVYFDTGQPANPYPSISGIHKGTIKPYHDIFVRKMYTYPCDETGGHSEYVRIRNSTFNATAIWKGYKEDWKNVTFDKTFTLLANETYFYEIITGSYPQIHRSPELREIEFSGYKWFVKGSGDWKAGPGPNYFSDSEENAWIDDEFLDCSHGMTHARGMGER